MRTRFDAGSEGDGGARGSARWIAFVLALSLATGCNPTVAPTQGSPEKPLSTLLENGKLAEAAADPTAVEAWYQRAVRAYPEHAAAWVHLGECQRFWLADLDLASSSFQRALTVPHRDPTSLAFAWRGLGEIARARGDMALAIEHFERSLSVAPLVDTYRSLSALYANVRHDFVRAAWHAERALECVPDDPVAWMQYAVQLTRTGQVAKASAAFERSVAIAGCNELGAAPHPIHCCVLYNGACYHAVNGDPARALAMLEAFFATPNHRHISREEILADPDLESIQGTHAFVELLHREFGDE
ncbi:MAG: tetratricopeptide repeat protein, partial [Planctomycetota bacterium]